MAKHFRSRGGGKAEREKWPRNFTRGRPSILLHTPVSSKVEKVILLVLLKQASPRSGFFRCKGKGKDERNEARRGQHYCLHTTGKDTKMNPLLKAGEQFIGGGVWKVDPRNTSNLATVTRWKWYSYTKSWSKKRRQLRNSFPIYIIAIDYHSFCSTARQRFYHPDYDMQTSQLWHSDLHRVTQKVVRKSTENSMSNSPFFETPWLWHILRRQREGREKRSRTPMCIQPGQGSQGELFTKGRCNNS